MCFNEKVLKCSFISSGLLLWAFLTDAKTFWSPKPTPTFRNAICSRNEMINLHLSPLRGQGVVSEVLVAAGVKVDAPRCEVRGVLEPATLAHGASNRCSSSFSLLSKSTLQPPILNITSTQTLSQLPISHLQRYFLKI